MLKTAGALGASAAVPTVSAATEEWTVEETPTNGTLYDVAYASDGAYAVGGDRRHLRADREGLAEGD